MKRPSAVPSLPLPAEAVGLPVLHQAASLGPPKRTTGLLSRAWQWICTRQLRRADAGRLQVAETVSLGEKRFVAVVQVDGRHFLLAGGPANIALLAQLDEKEPFAEVLQKTMTVAEKPATPNKPRKAPVARAAPPPRARLASRTQTPKLSVSKSANKAANDRTAAGSPVAAESIFSEVLSTAMTAAGRPPAKKAHKRTAPATLNQRQATYPPRQDDKTIAAQKKASATHQATPTAVNVKPAQAPTEENFEQWILQAALRQQSTKKSSAQTTRHSATKPSFSAAGPNGNKPAHARKEKPTTSLDLLSNQLSSAVPPPPRSNTITIEEYA